jgi:hypothetical protein
MAKAGTIRGLQVFISDIRACQNKEQETRRVDKELAKIRGKFGDEKKALTGEAVLLADGTITTQGSRTLLTGNQLYLVQPMTARSMSGSCCTSTCWATMWSLDTNRPVT